MWLDTLSVLKKKSKKTLKQISDESGVPLGTLNKLFAGQTKDPKLDTVRSVVHALGYTLDDLDGKQEEIKKTPFYSDEAMKLAEDYDDRMDDRGRETVRAIADFEVARKLEEEKSAKKAILKENRGMMEAAEEIACFILPYYLHPSSAGTGEYSTGDEWEELTMKKRPPRGTSYVVPVHGDSMEPTYHDGDKVFVRAGAEVRQGQIGIFIMDGEQYIKELGYGELISHNPGYGPKPMTEDARCQGLVLDVCDDSYFE